MRRKDKKHKRLARAKATLERCRYRDGRPEVVLGKPARYRAGVGIRKTGDRLTPSPAGVRVIVSNGVIQDQERYQQITGSSPQGLDEGTQAE
jgi:hypothetical protein